MSNNNNFWNEYNFSVLHTHVVVRGFMCFTIFSRDADKDCFCKSVGGLLSYFSRDSVHGVNVMWYFDSLESGDEVTGWFESWFAGNAGAEIWWISGRLCWPGVGKETERQCSLS